MTCRGYGVAVRKRIGRPLVLFGVTSALSLWLACVLATGIRHDQEWSISLIAAIAVSCAAVWWLMLPAKDHSTAIAGRLYGTCNLLAIALNMFLCFVVVSFFAGIGKMGYVDFPFFLKHDPADGSITYGHPIDQKTEVTTPRIEAFLDVYFAQASGMGAHYERSDTDDLTVRTFVGRIDLHRQDGRLTVNGTELATGQEFKAASYLHFHPWYMSRISFRNLGLVTVKHIPASKPRMVIHGKYGTEFSTGKGLSLLAVVLLLRVGVGLLLKDRSHDSARVAEGRSRQTPPEP
jgi:hypothetical protein